MLLLYMCQLAGLQSELQDVCRLLEPALVHFSHLLQRKYRCDIPLPCCRLVVDEALSFGTLGATGRGACEHWGLKPKDVEIIAASMGERTQRHATTSEPCSSAPTVVSVHLISSSEWPGSWGITATISAQPASNRSPHTCR